MSGYGTKRTYLHVRRYFCVQG